MGYGISFLRADDIDTIEVKRVIEEFRRNLDNGDLDSAFDLVSANYYDDTMPGNPSDRNQLRREIKEALDLTSQRAADISSSDFQFNNLNIQSNEAIVEVEYTTKIFDLDILRERTAKIRQKVALAKENGSWKIIKWRKAQ